MRAATALTVHGNQIVVAGEIEARRGLWRVQDGKLQPLVRGDYRDAAFNSDGTRLAVTYDDSGLSPTRYSVRVIDAPAGF